MNNFLLKAVLFPDKTTLLVLPASNAGSCPERLSVFCLFLNKLDMLVKEIAVFTDGACLGNPGPGGWAAILRWDNHEKILSGGYRLTTNNRMEILGVVEALSALKEPCKVTVTTDSQYVCNAVEKKWLNGWNKNGWKTSTKKPVKNKDLWEKLLPLLTYHAVRFAWVRGHNGHPENEQCDALARTWASRPSLPADTGFIPE